MTAGALLLTIGGLLICAGLVGVVAAIRGVALFPPHTHPPGTAPSSPAASPSSTRDGLPRWRVRPTHLAGAGAGMVVLLVTGWPVAAIATAAGVVFVPQVLGGGKAATPQIATAEALADWTRRLADLISSGAAGSTRDALRRSLNSVPAPIAVPVGLLVSRMGPQGTETALRRFAAEVADPAAEKIAGVLILRERNGGPGLADVLTGLALDLDERSRMVREVEAERAKPRANMRTIVTVTGLLIAAMMLFARTFLSTYSSVAGQVMLVVVVGVFALALRWMKSLSDPAAAPVVLTDPHLSPDTEIDVDTEIADSSWPGVVQR
jgi:tight adherence protein B